MVTRLHKTSHPLGTTPLNEAFAPEECRLLAWRMRVTIPQFRLEVLLEDEFALQVYLRFRRYAGTKTEGEFMSKVGREDAAERIREFVLEKFPLAKKRNLTIQDNLLDSGIIDSLGVLDLVGFLEEEFELQLSDEELLPENFQSVAHIVNLVENKHLPSSASLAASKNRL